MAHEPDLDLQKEPTIAAPSRRPSPVPWIVAVVVVAAAAAAYFFYVRDTSGEADVIAESTPAELPRAPVAPLGPAVEPIDLPPLDESDVLVRQLVRSLSSHPTVAAWLTTDGLIRNFVVVVENIAAGHTPAGRLRVLKPAEPFRAADAGGTPVIDPRSHARYDAIVAAAASLDPDGAARLYSTLKPRIEEAWSEVGHGPFDRALETAIVRLLEVPVVEGEIRLAPRGGVYHHADARLERLTQAQKQLLRMGPRNVRVIQRALRDTALALGIPPGRLPPG